MTRSRLIIAGLAIVAAFVVAVTATVTLTSTRRTAQPPEQPASSAAPPSASPSASPDTSGSELPDGEHADAPPEVQEGVWGPIVDTWGRNFTNTTGGQRKWRERLTGPASQPYVTAEVAEQLATVDLSNVPAGSYEGYELLKSTTYEVAVRVNYQRWAMVLWLVTDGTAWQIYAYDRVDE